ncbi:peptide transporter family 1-like isoform X2 [Episyrphus balteatus]|uniref:peptide transporter family 1-like isoform X2 n=1 Tax=Episyrphus balteatus TaxID=286459 RepID=UPI002485F536|nr:peptide transporter family 1-like isoform X2 [Episyrphus balteatus]
MSGKMKECLPLIQNRCIQTFSNKAYTFSIDVKGSKLNVNDSLEEIDLQGTLKYPKSVGFIIGNEFCERFNYYGMRTILVLYLTDKLKYGEDQATVLFHVFTSLVYVFPLIGAVLADSWLGRFKTIWYLSVVYTFGAVVIALGAVPPLNLPVKEATVIGLLLIATGTGGIKPCVSAFGGDQFKIPEQAKQLATFFSLFYFAINAGSLISTTITPILRADVHCFGDKDCFSLAFSVPAVLMVLSLVIFIAGKRLYVIKPPSGNMILGVSQCISEAIKGRLREGKKTPSIHWLDYAEGKCGRKLIADTKALLKILVLYLPLPVFWALFDQQGSRWTFQATRMVGDIGGFTIKPDQMQVINPLLILGFIPLFNYIVYPVLSLVGIRRPLQKLTLGGLLAAAAFLLSAFVELELEGMDPKLPGLQEAQLRIYNGMPCSYNFMSSVPLKGNLSVPIMGVLEEKDLIVANSMAYNYTASSSDPNKCPSFVGEFNLHPGKATSYFIGTNEVQEFEDAPGKPKSGESALRILMNIPQDEDQSIVLKGVDFSVNINKTQTEMLHLAAGMYSLTVDGIEVASLKCDIGGVTVVVVEGSQDKGYSASLHTLVEANSLHIMWQLPQYVVMTAAEVMFSVTGLEFSFTQAPASMKSVLQACWLLTVAFGNIIVVVIAKLKFFDSQAQEFILFAAFMVADMLIFIVLAMRFKYIDQNDDSDIEEDAGHPNPAESQVGSKKDIGHSNDAFQSDK